MYFQMYNAQPETYDRTIIIRRYYIFINGILTEPGFRAVEHTLPTRRRKKRQSLGQGHGIHKRSLPSLPWNEVYVGSPSSGYSSLQNRFNTSNKVY
jgi:hypothetical protein